jgi:Fe-Mn family superoxide dismutase
MQKSLPELKQIIVLAETAKETLHLQPLPYNRQDLSPVMSETTLDYHFGKLAKGYVDRFNSGEGDPEFNRAGAFLHNILFAQFRAPQGANKPSSTSFEFIRKHHQTLDQFKEEFAKTAMSIQGSGWVYLSRSGKIKTIKNHEIRQDIILLIDWWEHAFNLDYLADKEKYLKNIWRIINWSVIDDRINNKEGNR